MKHPDDEQVSLLMTARGLLEDMILLVRQEIGLAKAEIGEKASQVRTAMVAIVVGLLFGLASVVILAQVAVVALAKLMPDWLAAIMTGSILAVAAVIAFGVGASRLDPENLGLNRTMASIADDARRLKAGWPS